MGTRRSVTYLATIALAAWVLASCQRDAPSSTVSDSAFVAVMAELKRLHETIGLDSAERETRRAEILERRGFTPEQLDTVARALAKNPTRAQTVWQAIDRRAADSAAAK